MVGGRKLLHAGGDGRSSGVGIVISEEISKEVVRVERWNGRIIMAWAMIRKQLVCVMSVYGPQTGTDIEVTSRLKGMKKGRAPGWDEMRAEI